MRKLSPSRKRDSGAALLLALWALFLLAGVVFAWALNINSRLTVSATANRVLSAEAMASSGAEVALNPTIKPASANLHRKMGNESYDVQMSGECGRLNLNLLAPGGAENRPLVEILRKYLNLKGIEPNDVDTMVDSLLDWMSPPGLHRLSACPESDDYKPTHTALTSADDLKKVCGWAEFTSKPGWDEDFTLTSCGGAIIDIGWASRDVLRALLGSLGGVGDDPVDAFLQLRRGPDGIDGTIDDPQLDLQTALTTLGFRGGQPPQNLGLTLPQPKSTTVFRITSIGKSGDVTRSVQMVVQKQVTPLDVAAGVGSAIAVGRPTVISWKEL